MSILVSEFTVQFTAARFSVCMSQSCVDVPDIQHMQILYMVFSTVEHCVLS